MMTLLEFLRIVRSKFGARCTDEYWTWTYKNFKVKTREYIMGEMPYLAVRAVAIHFASGPLNAKE